jgi:hypothetical protein
MRIQAYYSKLKSDLNFVQEAKPNINYLDSDFILKSIFPSLTDGLELEILTLKLELSEQRAIVASQSRKVRELELKVKQLQEESSERTDIATRDPAVDQLGVTNWSSVVANEQTNKRSAIQLEILDANARKVKDRERRNKNLIIFGVKATIATTTKERVDYDTAAVKSILTELEVTTSPVFVRRFRGTNSQDGPIQVIHGSTHERNAILKIASKLRLNPARKGVYVNPDETPAQLKRSKELRAETDRRNQEKQANENTRDENFHYAIRDGQACHWKIGVKKEKRTGLIQISTHFLFVYSDSLTV